MWGRTFKVSRLVFGALLLLVTAGLVFVASMLGQSKVPGDKPIFLAVVGLTMAFGIGGVIATVQAFRGLACPACRVGVTWSTVPFADTVSAPLHDAVARLDFAALAQLADAPFPIPGAHRSILGVTYCPKCQARARLTLTHTLRGVVCTHPFVERQDVRDVVALAKHRSRFRVA